METKVGNETAKAVGFVAYWTAILAFWALAIALAGVGANALGSSSPWGGVPVFVLGALIWGGPFLFVEICRSRSWKDLAASASRIFGAGFVGTGFGGVLGLFWAAPLFVVVWFAIKRKTTALGPTLRRFPGRILAAVVGTALLSAAACAVVGSVASVEAELGYRAILGAFAVFYATAALAFALIAFKKATVDAETTCEIGDGGVANVAVEANEARRVGLGVYFAAALAFAALAFGIRETVDDGFWLSLALLWNFPFFCATFCDRRLWRDWPLSCAISSALPLLAVCCCVFTPQIAGLIAATLFGVWLTAIARTTAGEALTRCRGRIGTTVGLLALVETVWLFRTAIVEEHFWCSLTVGLGIMPLIAFHWGAVCAVVLGPKRRSVVERNDETLGLAEMK